jgi:hypothetical protein
VLAGRWNEEPLRGRDGAVAAVGQDGAIGWRRQLVAVGGWTGLPVSEVVGMGDIVVADRDHAERVEALLERVVGEVAELRAMSAGGVVQYPAGAGGGDFGLAGCPPGYWPCQRCCGVNLRKIENRCAGFVVPCLSCAFSRTVEGCTPCLICLFVFCPYVVFQACRFCWTCCPESPPWGP